jgi:hypothetical protein
VTARLPISSGLLVLAVLVSGCGGGSSTPSAHATASTGSSATASASGSASASASASPSPASPSSPSLTGADLAKACARKPLHQHVPAAAAFGNAAFTTAYCSMVGFTFEQGTSNLASARDHHTVADLAFVRPFLTPNARKYWDSEVRKGIAQESATAWQNVAGLSLVDLTAFRRFTPPASGPVCTHPSFTPPQSRLFQKGRARELVLRFTMRCDLSLVKKGAPTGTAYQVPFVNDREFTLAATNSRTHPWLIDGWTGYFRFAGRPAPVPASTG